MFGKLWNCLKNVLRRRKIRPLEGLSLRFGACPVDGISPALVLETATWRRSIRLTDGGDCYYRATN